MAVELQEAQAELGVEEWKGVEPALSRRWRFVGPVVQLAVGVTTRSTIMQCWSLLLDHLGGLPDQPQRAGG
jgi:hypothetical protein